MGKRAVLLYNPMSGDRKVLLNLDYIITRLQKMDYIVSMYRSMDKGGIENYIINHITNDNTDLILISGGDGTLNGCINGMMLKELTIPLAILPLGTCNDLAYTLRIPEDIKGALDVLQEGNLEKIDLGKVNDRYFVNVCNMGMFSEISHTTDLEMKKNLGRLAYYIKGIEKITDYKPMSLEITIDGVTLQNKYVLFFAFNGKRAGGFDKLAKNASIQDGMFDIIGIQDVQFHEIPGLFFKVLNGEHFNDQKVDFVKGQSIRIECTDDQNNIVVDIDGERGPVFPLEISIIKDGLNVYVPI